MAIGDDFSIAANNDIRYTGTTANYTVLAFHRWLQDLADDATAGADALDITEPTPSEKAYDTIITLINGFNIDDTAAQHLYGGSIIQSNGDVIYDGIQVLAPAGMHLEIIQNGALIATNFWTTGLNADPTNGISHQFMLKVRTGGADTDGRRLIGLSRVFGKTYGEFKVNGTARGVNVMAFTGWTDDLNNATGSGTVSGWTITNLSEGYNSMDVEQNGTTSYYYSKWDKGSRSINDLYEYLKYITRYDSATTIYGLSGKLFRGITHEVAYSGKAGGNFADSLSVSWGAGATAGTGQILADNASNKMWIQHLTGVAPVGSLTLTQGGVTATSGTVTERSVSTPVCGQSTGTNIIGAFGFGIEAGDLTVGDKVFDLSNVQHLPPNAVTFKVGNLEYTPVADYVLVGPATGNNLDVGQLSLNTTLNTDNVTSVVVTTTIPSDTPVSGYIRVADDNGVYRRLHYSSYTGSTFTIDSTDGQEDFGAGKADATAGNNVFIAYIDKVAGSAEEQFQCTYSSPRTLYVRVRHGDSAAPIKTFFTTASLPSAGSTTVTTIRTSDA